MPYNILLADDNREFREEFSELLGDYNVVQAGTGEEALEILRRPNMIDIVILDERMPGASGTDILPLIKSMNPDLAVIIMTGYSSKETAISALRGNADEYIEKPIDIEKTERVIRDLILSRGKSEELYPDTVDGKIDLVKSFVRRNYHKTISLDDVAELVCLSPKYLSRLFKEKTGCGFSEYRLRVKVEKAKELLLGTGGTIDQISYDMGYKNMESFIRIFKKFTGMTPTEFRRNNPG